MRIDTFRWEQVDDVRLLWLPEQVEDELRLGSAVSYYVKGDFSQSWKRLSAMTVCQWTIVPEKK